VLYPSDGDGTIASPWSLMPCKEKSGPPPRLKAWALMRRDRLVEQMQVGDPHGLAFLAAVLRDRGDTSGAPLIVDLFRADAFVLPSLAREEVVLEMARGVGSIVDDPAFNTGRAPGNGELDVGHVARVFRERAEARNGPRLFPARGAPLSPEDQARARANRLLTVISRRPQPERERIWRRFRVFETYMA